MDLTGLFFVGTDTDVGKTHCATRFIARLRQQGIKVGAYKPVASGISASETAIEDLGQRREADPGDAYLLCRAAGLDLSLLSRVCPQSFRAPLAPPLAAALEGRSVDDELLVSGADWWRDKCQYLVVEGAGGIMSPLSQRLTVADLAARLQLPLVLVAANRLGCVSQVLSAAEVIAGRNLQLTAVLLNSLPSILPGQPNSEDGSKRSDRSTESNFELLRQFLPNALVIGHAEELLEILDLPR